MVLEGLKAPLPVPPTGPNHVSMQQTAQSTLPTTSMSMSGSGHGTGPGYSHSGPASQSVPLQGQGAIGNYVSRANINMQSNPGTSPLGPGRPPPDPGPDNACGPEGLPSYWAPGHPRPTPGPGMLLPLGPSETRVGCAHGPEGLPSHWALGCAGGERASPKGCPPPGAS